MTTLLYDASFEGFLTAIFEVYENKLADVKIRKDTFGDATLWGNSWSVTTDNTKASRVWQGLKSKTSEAAARHFYSNYLSELPNEEDNMLEYLRYVFISQQDVSEDYSYPSVLRVAKVSKMVAREKHRMEAFVRFQQMDNGIWYATIAPDFNVLPLILKHFKSRYADQKWFIADTKRGYGIYYDLEKAEMIHEGMDAFINPLNGVEKQYQNLWKTYFKHVNIVERRNIKLHLQHVPTRYWKYLSEKQP